MEVKKGDRVEIIFYPQKEYIGKRGIIVKAVALCEGIRLYRVRCGGKLLRNYATKDCFKVI